MQVLADGQVLVGWGNLPYFSQFTADGTLILDGQFPVGDQSYRAFTAAWTGHPTDKPAVAARVNPAGGSVVYASWNGATEVNTWTVLAGQDGGRAGQGRLPAAQRLRDDDHGQLGGTVLRRDRAGRRRARARPVGHRAGRAAARAAS